MNCYCEVYARSVRLFCHQRFFILETTKVIVFNIVEPCKIVNFVNQCKFKNLFSFFVDIIGELLSQPRPEGLTEIICPKNGSERVNVALVYPPTPTVVSPSHKWHWLHLHLPACEWPSQTAAPLSPTSYVHTCTHTEVYVFVLAKACAPISCCLYLSFLIWGGWWTTGYRTSAKKVYNGSLSWGGHHNRTYLQVYYFVATYKTMNHILDLQLFFLF